MPSVAERMKSIMRKIPHLTDFGFENPSSDKKRFAENRDKMLEPRSLGQFLVACDWWAQRRKTLVVNPRAGSSYGLKHFAAREIGYVTNGIFIAAAIAEGFRYKEDGPNAHFNIRIQRR